MSSPTTRRPKGAALQIFIAMAMAMLTLPFLAEEGSAQYTNQQVTLSNYDTGGNFTTRSLSDDQVSSTIPIGFTFQYFGQATTGVRISSNGFVYMGSGGGSTSGCCSGGTIPSTSDPDNMIAGYWSDIYPPGGQRIKTQTIGTAPNRRFVVWFDRVPDCCTTTLNSNNTNDFQIVLFETTNVFEIRIRSGGSDGRTATVGFESADGSAGTQLYRSSTILRNRTYIMTPTNNNGGNNNGCTYANTTVNGATLITTGSFTTRSLSDDQVSATIPIGFSFTYFDQATTGVRISSNGYVYMGSAGGTTNGCCSGGTIPSSSDPDNMIAGYWSDIYPPGGQRIKTATVGTAPNRQFIVWFDRVPDCCTTSLNTNNTNNFQIVLFEGSNNFEIRIVSGGSDGRTATVGYENANGSAGHAFHRSTTILRNTTFRAACDGGNPAPPTITNIPNQSGTVGQAFSFQVQANDPNGDAITYAASGLPAGVTINTGTGLISGTPTAAGTSNVTVTVTANGDSANDTFTFTVQPGLQACTYANRTVSGATLITSGSFTTRSLSDDQVSATIPIGFTFQYFNQPTTGVRISSNGYVYMGSAGGTTNGCCSGGTIPSATDPDNMIAGYWSDIYPPGGQRIKTATVGTAPNRQFIVWFDRVPDCCTTSLNSNNTNNFQIILFEGSNNFEIRIVSGGSDGRTATVGYENANGSAGHAFHRSTTILRNTTFVADCDGQFQQNTPPVLTAIPNQSGFVGSAFSFQPTATDANGDSLTWTATGLPNGVTINANTGLISGTPTAASNGTVTVTVNDGQATAQRSFTFTVINNPNNCTYGHRTVTGATLITSGNFTTRSLSDDQVSSTIPIGFTFHYNSVATTGVRISSNGFVYMGAAGGTTSGCCSGGTIPSTSDPDNMIAGYWSDIYPPGGQRIKTATVGTAPNRQFVVWFDRIPDCCTTTLNSNNTNNFQIVLFETSNNFEIRIVSGGSDGRTATVGYENATGSAGHSFHRSTTILRNTTFIADCDGQFQNNSAPSITAIPNQSGTVSQAFSFQVQASDPDNDTLAYSATGLPNGININSSSGLISGTPSAAGTSNVTVTVNDGNNHTAQTSFTFTVQTPTSNCTTYASRNVALSAYDTTGTFATRSLSDDQVSAAIPIGFTFNYFAVNHTTVRISSNGFVYLGNTGGTTSGCCSGGTIPSTSDPDNMIAGYWSDIYPPGAQRIKTQTIGTAPNRRFVVWFDRVPDCCTTTLNSNNTNDFQIVLFEGSNNFEIRIRSGGSDGRTATVGYDAPTGGPGGAQLYRSSTILRNRTFEVACNGQVQQNQTPTITNIANQSGVVGNAFSFQVQAADPDGDTLTYSATGLPNGVTINASSGLISGTPTATGTSNVSVTVSDGNATANDTFTFTVTGNPNNCTYASRNVALSAYDTTGNFTTRSLSDDQVSSTIPIGFTFHYFGQATTGVRISSNGFVYMGAAGGSTSGCCSGGTIPSTSDPDNMIAGYWSDIYPPGGQRIKTQTIGTAPNRRFVVWFDRVPDCCTTTLNSNNTNDFQIVLFETNNNFEIRIRSGGSDGRTATVGYENSNGSAGVQLYRSSTILRNRTFQVDCDGQFQNNGTPTITAIPDSSAVEANSVSIQVQAADPDGDALTYSATGLPGALTINANTGLISGTLAQNTAGAHSITVTVSDGQATAQDTFVLTVTAPPAPCNYANRTLTSTTFDTTGTFATVSMSDDQVSPLQNIGFTFQYYGQTHTQVRISSNGFVYMGAAGGTTSGCCSGGTIPATSDPDNMIAGWWDDLYPPGGQRVKTQTIGTAPNRRYVVWFDRINRCCSSGTTAANVVDFQVVLYETSNNFDIRVRSGVTGTHTIGYENNNGSAGHTFFRGDTNTLQNHTFSADCDGQFQQNGTPTITAVPDQTGVIGSAFSFQVQAADPDGDSLTYTATNLPNGVTINASTGLISGTPTAAGNSNVTVRVTDGQAAATDAFTFTVNNNPNNCTYASRNITLADYDTSGTFATRSLSDDQVSSTIPIGFTFHYFGQATTGVRISSNGFVYMGAAGGSTSGCCSGGTIPSTSDPDNMIAGYWSDIYPPGAQRIKTQTIGTAPNRRFVVWFDRIPDCCTTTLNSNNTNDFQIVLFETSNDFEIRIRSGGSDGRTATVGYENSNGSAGVQLYRSSTILRNRTFQVACSGEFQQNNDPTLTAIPTQNGIEGQAFSFQVQGADEDDDTLTYSVTGLPNNLSINSSSGLISGTLALLTANTYSVTVTVTDGNGGSANTQFNLVVRAPTPPTVTLTAPTEVYHNAAVTVTGTVTDLGCSSNPIIQSTGGVTFTRTGGPNTWTITATNVTGRHTPMTVTAISGCTNRQATATRTFGVDTAQPLVIFGQFNQSGVVISDPTTWPTQAKGVEVPMIMAANDPLSGIRSVTVVAQEMDNQDNSLTLFSQNNTPTGTLPTGPLTQPLSACSLQTHCANGRLKTGALNGGRFRLTTTVTDVAGNIRADVRYFRALGLREAIVAWQGEAGTLSSDNPNATVELNRAAAAFTLSLQSIDEEFFGNMALTLQVCQAALNAARVHDNSIDLDAANDLASVVATALEGFYQQRSTDARNENQNDDSIDEFDTADDFLTDARAAEDVIEKINLLANAFFWMEDGTVPMVVRDGNYTDSRTVLQTILDQMDAYITNDPEMVGRTELAEARTELAAVMVLIARIVDSGSDRTLDDLEHATLLIGLTNTAEDLRDSQALGAWVRNWQWGLTQITFLYAERGLNNAASFIGFNNPVYLRGLQELNLARTHQDNRRADDFMRLLIDSRCLTIAVYNRAYDPDLVPPTACCTLMEEFRQLDPVFTVPPICTNNRPEVTNPGSQTSSVDEDISLQIQASDQDDDTLSYSAQNLPPGLTIDAESGIISGTIANNNGSPHSVTVTVSDGSETRSVNFTWTIEAGGESYSQQLVNGQSYTSGSAQCDNWGTFRTGLTGNYTRITARGSLFQNGFVCNGAAADQICEALRTGATANITCDGRSWQTQDFSGNGRPGDIRLAVNAGINSCSQNPGTIGIVRPCINNRNWGGMGNLTCGAPTQTLEVICE